MLASMAASFAVCAAPVGGLYAQSRANRPPRLTLKGYDPVAYFTEGKAVQGREEFSFDWDDAHYLFSNAKNRNLFAGNSDRYAPQFAGFCTTGMSLGTRTEADPRVWIVSEEKLYVFASPTVKKMAEKDLPGTIARARQHWLRATR